MNHQVHLFLFLLISGLFLYSCQSGVIYEESIKIDESNWNRKSLATYEFNIADSAASYSFFLNFRHGGMYPYKNIYLFCRSESPSGKIAIDTAQMMLTNDYNRWMGKGIGDLFDYKFKFKEGEIFPEKGTYHFSIQQGMRDSILTAVTDIGITIKIKSNP